MKLLYFLLSLNLITCSTNLVKNETNVMYKVIPNGREKRNFPDTIEKNSSPDARERTSFPNEIENSSSLDVIQRSKVPTFQKTLDFPGLEVKPKYRYSWVASLEYEQKHVCSGTLYFGNLVITAASCIKGKLGDWRVSSKRHDLDISADKEKSKYFAVKSTHIHPEYVPATKAYDISIWKIDAPQSSNNLIKLDDGRWSNAGDFLLTVIGWGVGNNYSNLQREIQISIIRGSKCRPLHENLDNFSQFCVSYPQGATNYCQYEPGAPITILKNGELLLVGIAASDVCIDDKNPGIFIKAGAFVKFINNFI